jgi:hypothetical protein
MQRLVVCYVPIQDETTNVSDHRLFVAIGGKKVSTKEKRWYKDVGLGFKTPPEAINGTYIGVCAPFAFFEYPIDGASENR